MLTSRRHRLTAVRCTELCKSLLHTDEFNDGVELVRSKRLDVLCLFGLLEFSIREIGVDDYVAD